MTNLSTIAEGILQERYYDRDDNGDFIEDWNGLSRRVSKHIAAQELKYGLDPEPLEEEFYNAIFNLDFLPNTPCLMNAGSIGGLNLLSACFVQIPDDSLDSIMEHAWHSAKLFQAGAGVGYNFSHLRSDVEMVKTSMRPSSGACSFMKSIFNSVGDVVKQGGRRRAAMMGLMNDDHPEIEKFITFKNHETALENFNISIFASDRFMRAIENNEMWDLHKRKDGNYQRSVSARELFRTMMANNKKMAEPGMIWRDNINRQNPLVYSMGDIECVNPCGEATLYNYENCCLGSVNLMNHISNGQIDFNKLRKTVQIAVRFLDNVVDANTHVHPKFEEASLNTRRIGIGVNGFADLLVNLNSVYGSSSSYDIAEQIGSFMNRVSVEESKRLALIKGEYPLWRFSEHKESNLPLRNVSLLALAPEGSRSLIAGVSSSIEPNFGRKIVRTTKGIGSGTWVHPLAEMPSFITNTEVPFEAHIKMQATWQNAINKNKVGQGISKTILAPASVSEDELGEAYLEAWRLGCKGFTVYVDGSRDAVYYESRENEMRDEQGRIIQECATGACDIGFEKG